eukprot:m.42931 g.42931  ORF g.42931 m.42931 type:complete len:132 (+) comp10750_c0_seq1:618-1013(+)
MQVSCHQLSVESKSERYLLACVVVKVDTTVTYGQAKHSGYSAHHRIDKATEPRCWLTLANTNPVTHFKYQTVQQCATSNSHSIHSLTHSYTHAPKHVHSLAGTGTPWRRHSTFGMPPHAHPLPAIISAHQY